MGGGLRGTEGRKPQSIHVCVSDFPSSSPERLTSSELLGVAHDNGAFCPATGSSAFGGMPTLSRLCLESSWEPKRPPARVRGTRLAQANTGPALPAAFLPTLSY